MIAHSSMSRSTSCLKVVQSVLQLSYFVDARSESSGEVIRTCMIYGANHLQESGTVQRHSVCFEGKTFPHMMAFNVQVISRVMC